MSNIYHPGKDNFVHGDLRRFSMGCTAYLEKEKEERTKEVHRLAWLGVQLIDSIDRRILVKNEADLSLGVKREREARQRYHFAWIEVQCS